MTELDAIAGDPRGTATCPVCDGASVLERDGMYDDRYGYPGRFPYRRCRRCGHIFVGAAFTEAQLLALYAEYYPRGVLRLEDFRPRQEVHGVRAWLDGEYASAFRWVPRDVRVLDVGCGFGETLAYHAARGCDAYGVDADENLGRVAEHFGLNGRVGLFRAADYEPASFDYVTLDQVVEHVSDPRDFMRDVASVLRPGGTVVVTTPYAGSLGRRVFGRRWINWHVPYHQQQFTRRSLSELAESAGLTVVSMRTLTNSRWLHYQALHLAAYPRAGVPSPVWDPRQRRRRKMRGRRVRFVKLLGRAGIYAILTRVADATGRGDNLLCVLRKPA